MSSPQDRGHTEKLDESSCKRIRVWGIVIPPTPAVSVNQVRDQLEDLISNYGRTKECRVMAPKTGKRATAIVTFESHEDAATALAKLQGVFEFLCAALVHSVSLFVKCDFIT